MILLNYLRTKYEEFTLTLVEAGVGLGRGLCALSHSCASAFPFCSILVTPVQAPITSYGKLSLWPLNFLFSFRKKSQCLNHDLQHSIIWPAVIIWPHVYSPTLAPGRSLASWHPHASELCTGCALCLECFSLRYPRGELSHFLWVFVKIFSETFPGPPVYNFNFLLLLMFLISLSLFNFLFSTYFCQYIIY